MGGPRDGPPYPPALVAPRGTRGAPRFPRGAQLRAAPPRQRSRSATIAAGTVSHSMPGATPLARSSAITTAPPAAATHRKPADATSSARPQPYRPIVDATSAPVASMATSIALAVRLG